MPYRYQSTSSVTPSFSYSANSIQDIILGLFYSILALISFLRTIHYFDLRSNQRVITIFYLLIFLTASVRSVWFLIPTNVLEGSYTPQPTWAYESEHWRGTLVSEIMLAFGSVCLFSGFILVCSYWSRMLQSQEAQIYRPKMDIFLCCPHGTLTQFFTYFILMVCIEGANISLFLLRRINSELMILIDSLFLSIVSVLTMARLAYLSSKIRELLEQIGAINATSTQPQIRRIFAITVAVNMFFLIRVGIECAFALSIITLMRKSNSLSVLMSDKYWNIYILTRHISEIIVLSLELLISTPLKQYSNNRRQQTLSLSPPKHLQSRRIYNLVSTNISTESTPLVKDKTLESL